MRWVALDIKFGMLPCTRTYAFDAHACYHTVSVLVRKAGGVEKSAVYGANIIPL